MSEDAVVYQNWVMKRSQMTRVFRRRFTVLTTSGKLHSFRKVDLTKPETLLPANASLSWDIRNALVESAPKLGRHTWVVRPTPSSPLREEVYLRTCSVCPDSSCMHWMKIMAAVASQNLSTIFDRVSLLSVVMEIPSLAKTSVVYGEIEGSLFNISTQGGGQIPIRSPDPGSCLILREFSQENSGESPVAESEPFPRYTFYKAKCSFPWTRLEQLNVSLFGRAGTKHGTISLSINEGILDYCKPLITAERSEPEAFDFAVFKFQIRRLIRIIDKIGDIKQRLQDVFEWRDFRTSAYWVLYFSLALLVFPGYIPVFTLVQIALFSFSQSEYFVGLWNRLGVLSPPPSRVDEARTALKPVSVVSSPVRATSSANPPTSLKDAASNAIHQVTTAIANVRSSAAASPSIKPEIWENQRRTFGGSQFTASNLSVFDRSRWSDDSGKIALDPPSSGDWKINLDSGNSDENGWSYNTRWGAADWHSSFTGWDFVRRRCWIPIPRLTVDTTSQRSSQQPSPSGPSEPLDISGYPTSLSALVTTGTDFGNIQEDYDETNAEYQPKQAGLGSMFNEFRATAGRAQTEIGDICNTFEKIFSIFSWRDEVITTAATASIVLGIFALLLVPVNYIIYVYIMSFFHLGYQRHRWLQVAVNSCLHHHVSPLLPLNTDPRTLSGLEAHRLCLSINKRTGLNLSQKVLADMPSTREISVWICLHSPAFSQYRKWMRRDWIENLLDHIPPEVSVEQQLFFSERSRFRQAGSSTPEVTDSVQESDPSEPASEEPVVPTIL